MEYIYLDLEGKPRLLPALTHRSEAPTVPTKQGENPVQLIVIEFGPGLFVSVAHVRRETAWEKPDFKKEGKDKYIHTTG
jgi:hypothetical protein